MLTAISIDRDGDRALIAILIDRDRDRARQESGRRNAAASEQASGLAFFLTILVLGRQETFVLHCACTENVCMRYNSRSVFCVLHSLWDSWPSPLHSVGGFPAVSLSCTYILRCLESDDLA